MIRKRLLKPCIVSACLAAAPGAWAQAGSGDAPLGRALPVADEPAGEAADSSRKEPAVEQLAAGRAEKGEGNIARAELHFQQALAAAERDGETYQAALEELTYHLPLMRVERYVINEQWPDAERLLQSLIEQHQSDEEKNRHLVKLMARLRGRNPGEGAVYAEEGAGKEAVRQVQQVLERFLEENGRYPSGYDELNEILPAGRYPLAAYDIVHYVGHGRAYGLTLRSRVDPASLLSVQKTGMMR